MIFTPQFRIQFDSSLSTFREDLPWMMVGASIMFGVAVVLYLIIQSGRCCLGSAKPRPSRTRNSNKRSSRSFIRVLLVLLCTIVAFFGFWIAFSVMGVNFWNILFGYGILVYVLGQMFGISLQQVGAYITVSYTDKIQEDYSLEILGLPGLKGTVAEINLVWVQLDVFDAKGAYVGFLHVPTVMFVNNPVFFPNASNPI